jgi:isopentenyldiphosphate isomerase
MEKEKIAICDQNGKPLDIETRQEVHKQGSWHETFHCWFTSKAAGKDRIHLQLRSSEKKDFPSLFDITAAGHILADETIRDGVREIEEELGIAVSFEELVPLGVIPDQIHQDGFLDNERCHVFLYQAETGLDAKYALQKEEVAGMFTADFQHFYELCFGTRQEIEAAGFEVLPDGTRAAVRKQLSLGSLVPHSEGYLQNVALSIKTKLAG